MGRRWAVRGVCAALAPVLTVFLVGGAGAYASSTPVTPGAATAVPPARTVPTTTTLPPLPDVPASITDGQSATTLLANAVSLSSVGHDDSMLLAAVGLTQTRLDRDAATASAARASAAAAEAAAQSARRAAAEASARYDAMKSALRSAVVYLYIEGPDPLPLDPRNGELNLYAEDYATSTMSPYGVLASARETRADRAQDLADAQKAERQAQDALTRANKAEADQAKQVQTLEAEMQLVSHGTEAAVAADHLSLAAQSAKYLAAGPNPLEFNPPSPPPAPLATTSVALHWAFSELGRPYVWGATGPDAFDCSGLTQYAWKAAGVQIPRVAADQDSWTIPVPLSQLLPGDLVFFGTTDIHHVGIYIGDGLMINAPHTGDVVRVSSIWWSDLAGFGRVHSGHTPVPAHDMPVSSKPLPPVVKPGLKPVPSQTAPPKGWKPKPGSTTPILVSGPTTGSSASTTTVSTSTTAASAGGNATTTTAPGGGAPDTTTTTSLVVPPATDTTTTTSTTTAPVGGP